MGTSPHLTSIVVEEVAFASTLTGPEEGTIKKIIYYHFFMFCIIIYTILKLIRVINIKFTKLPDSRVLSMALGLNGDEPTSLNACITIS